MTNQKHLYSGLLLLALIVSVQSLDCLNGAGQPVAWWAKLKLPKSLKTSAHLYYDANDDSAGKTNFNLISTDIDDASSAMSKTLDQLNHIPRSSLKVMAFNDEFPNGKTVSDRAHAKGVIAVDATTKVGFYIMHSVPKFPTIDDDTVNIKLPSTGLIYAQNFMCITIDAHGFDSLIAGLGVARPNVYYDNASLKPPNSPLNTHAEAIHVRLNGQKMMYFTKSPKLLEYFFSYVISPYYNVDLIAETWSHPVEPPQCDGRHKCLNIHSVKFNNQITWNVAQDHSKWAISYQGDRKIACFADINRAASQKKRGGGALCFDNNSNLHHALTNLVVSYDQCETEFLPIFDELKSLVDLIW